VRKPKQPPKSAAAIDTTIKYDDQTHRYYLDPAVTNMSYGGQLQIKVNNFGRNYFLLVTITSQPSPTEPGSINRYLDLCHQ